MKASEWLKHHDGKWVKPPSSKSVVKRAMRSIPRAVGQVHSFTRTMTGGKTTQEVFGKRMIICMACNARKSVDGKNYCNACGCGQWKLAELSTKLWFRKLECPRGKFGPA